MMKNQFFICTNIFLRNHYKNKLREMISEAKVEWREEYHPFWNCPEGVNSQIVCLLLISRNKKESKKKESDFLVKGITIKIIKYLCHFT